MLPLRLFRSPTFSGASFVGLAINLGFYGQLFVMSLYFQHVRSWSALATGLAFLPEGIFVALSSALSGRAMGRVGWGVFEMVSDLRREWKEFEWMGEMSRASGVPVTFAALQSIAKELPLDEQIAAMERENAKGARIVASIALRGNGIVMAWRGTVHPFR